MKRTSDVTTEHARGQAHALRAGADCRPVLPTLVKQMDPRFHSAPLGSGVAEWPDTISYSHLPGRPEGARQRLYS